jgi:hypothetical protein
VTASTCSVTAPTYAYSRVQTKPKLMLNAKLRDSTPSSRHLDNEHIGSWAPSPANGFVTTNLTESKGHELGSG